MFCSNKVLTPISAGTLLIAFATTSKQLRIVRALVDWGLGKQMGDRPPPIPQQLNPNLKTRHAVATSWLHDVSRDTLNASNMESSMMQLSHLEFLPAAIDLTGRMTPPTIVTARSHLPPSMAHYNQDVHTVVDRWELRDKMQSVHPAFEQLSSRRNSVGSPPGVSSKFQISRHLLTGFSLPFFLKNWKASP